MLDRGDAQRFVHDRSRGSRSMRNACAVLVAGLLATVATPVSAETPNRAELASSVKSSHATNLKRLQDWIALPTIAAEKRGTPQGAEHMRQLLLDAGFQQAKIVPTSGVPGVFATLDAGAPTTLGIYFMYDVKQYDPAEWSAPPLEGRIVDRPGLGKVMIGRGATNQKGPQMALLAALHAFKAAGKKVPINIVLVCEGEEEIGSPNFSEVALRPDVKAALEKSIGVIIPMGSQEPDGSVTINLGAKGIVELELVSSAEKWGRGPAADLHSSLFASVDSPAWR